MSLQKRIWYLIARHARIHCYRSGNCPHVLHHVGNALKRQFYPCLCSSRRFSYPYKNRRTMFCMRLDLAVAIDFRAHRSLLKRLQHIRNEIGLIFDSTTDANQVVEDTRCLALLLRNATMGHGARNFDQ